MEFTIMPLEDEDGRMTGMAAILHDVTERFDEMKAPRRKFAEVEELARHATSD